MGCRRNRAEQKRAHAGGEVPNTITSSDPKQNQINNFKLLTFCRWIFAVATGKTSLLARKCETRFTLPEVLWIEERKKTSFQAIKGALNI